MQYSWHIQLFSGFSPAPWHRRSTFLGIQLGWTSWQVTVCFEQGSGPRSQQMLLLEPSNLQPTCMHTCGMTSILCILVAVLDVCLRIMEAKMHQNQLSTGSCYLSREPKRYCAPRSTVCWTCVLCLRRIFAALCWHVLTQVLRHRAACRIDWSGHAGSMCSYQYISIPKRSNQWKHNKSKRKPHWYSN